MNKATVIYEFKSDGFTGAISAAEGAVVQLLEPETESGWIRVRNLNTNQEGFVSASYLSNSKFIADPPPKESLPPIQTIPQTTTQAPPSKNHIRYSNRQPRNQPSTPSKPLSPVTIMMTNVPRVCPETEITLPFANLPITRYIHTQDKFNPESIVVYVTFANHESQVEALNRTKNLALRNVQIKAKPAFLKETGPQPNTNQESHPAEKPFSDLTIIMTNVSKHITERQIREAFPNLHITLFRHVVDRYNENNQVVYLTFETPVQQKEALRIGETLQLGGIKQIVKPSYIQTPPTQIQRTQPQPQFPPPTIATSSHTAPPQNYGLPPQGYLPGPNIPSYPPPPTQQYVGPPRHLLPQQFYQPGQAPVRPMIYPTQNAQLPAIPQYPNQMGAPQYPPQQPPMYSQPHPYQPQQYPPQQFIPPYQTQAYPSSLSQQQNHYQGPSAVPPPHGSVLQYTSQAMQPQGRM
ncbi:hypothetical protein BLNAU_398 [Blattamonas nauphoetae]|uniref:SH3 domain-containing protein n=1 Tax=Blattamonas nauphoetae TaxID=2049346 RepID=A0ABQ9YL65_9EUKA|nr:hypothetical protein BLNAU_398 [Blattamonas nauphoetae]